MEHKKSKPKFWLVVLILFIILQIGDGLLTYYILTIKTPHVVGIEKNPLVRYVLETVGVLPGLMLVKLWAIVLGFFIYTHIILIQDEAKPSFIKITIILMLLSYILNNIWAWYLVYYAITAFE